MSQVSYIEFMTHLFNLFLWISILIFFFFLFKSVPQRRTRWKRFETPPKSKSVIAKVLWVSPKKELVNRYDQLLLGCGWSISVMDYLMLKRLLIGGIVLMGVIVKYLFNHIANIHPIYSTILIGIFAVGLSLIWFDRIVFDVFRKKRRNRIIREIYILSNQLLYYQGSKMNLHTKLMNCIPFTKTIRNEMYLLTNEWYEDSESAIRRFKYRLGTDEGYSFAETLNSLRLYDSDHYYDLLKQRILDYKEKIELLNESKKETNSYILFILAGIPILNTFRIFIYPWVQEGRKLFESLN